MSRSGSSQVMYSPPPPTLNENTWEIRDFVSAMYKHMLHIHWNGPYKAIQTHTNTHTHARYKHTTRHLHGSSPAVLIHSAIATVSNKHRPAIPIGTCKGSLQAHACHAHNSCICVCVCVCVCVCELLKPRSGLVTCVWHICTGEVT